MVEKEAGCTLPPFLLPRGKEPLLPNSQHFRILNHLLKGSVYLLTPPFQVYKLSKYQASQGSWGGKAMGAAVFDSDYRTFRRKAFQVGAAETCQGFQKLGIQGT